MKLGWSLTVKGKGTGEILDTMRLQMLQCWMGCCYVVDEKGGCDRSVEVEDVRK